MNRRTPSRLPSRGLVSLAVAALVFGVRYDAYAYGNHRDKQGEGALVEHAEGLPDLARGRQAAIEGRLDDAEADLKPLAERGYVEAQIALASLYAELGTPERVAEAIGWLRTARNSSPLDTETPLGRLLVRQNDEASIGEGRALLGDAWQRHHDPAALAGLIRLYSEQPRRDADHQVAALVAQAERIGTPDVRGAIIDWYRSTRGDDGHADKLVSLCDRWVDQVPGCYVDLARAARADGHADRLQSLVKAAGDRYADGRVDAPTLASLARVLVAPLDTGDDDDDDGAAPSAPVRISDVSEDEGELGDTAVQAQAARGDGSQVCTRVVLTPPDGAAVATTTGASAARGLPAQADMANALLGKLFAGPTEAAVLAAGVVARYPYLLPNVDVQARLERGATQGVPEASLYLGQLYLGGERTQRDPQQALRYLQQAAAQPATALKGHYYLGRLYQYGYLDESRPLLAAQYLMWSARRGDAAADGALARLFVNGKGLCPNLRNADVFARLGAHEGSASAAQLERQIAALLPAEQLASVDQMYSAELAVRPSAYQIPKTMLAEAAAIARQHGIDPAADDAAVDGAAVANVDPATGRGGDAVDPAIDNEAVDASAASDTPAVPAVPAAAATSAAVDPAPSSPAATAPVDRASREAQTIPASDADAVPDIATTTPATPPSGVDAAVSEAAPTPPVPSATPPATAARDALALKLSARFATPPATPQAPLHLSHRASDDPALRKLLESSSQTAATPSSTVTEPVQAIEYTVPLQTPATQPGVPDPSRSGDPS
ncbi:hypothetical protein [Solimonas terrae]|uniref:Sel1 repeat family protein n=1 Tax=Solimonas terrae TaxID=1396819 RepID=A0A6M2BPW9_9GAMM|nr:hypothetical protein [Solimonas terrae]NGY04636.1 hypothetical protein [Solimonas terrae]